MEQLEEMLDLEPGHRWSHSGTPPDVQVSASESRLDAPRGKETADKTPDLDDEGAKYRLTVDVSGNVSEMSLMASLEAEY